MPARCARCAKNSGCNFRARLREFCALKRAKSVTLAAEVGPKGVRVLVLQPNALPESETLQESFRKYASGLGIKAEDALVGLADTTMLKRLPTLEEFSNVASFVASDKASALTGSIIKIDCGA